MSRQRKPENLKKRRKKRHNKRTTKVKQLEVRKGTQYQSGLGFSATEQEQMEQIPQPTTLPVMRKACTGDDMKYEKVVFDSETTSRATFRDSSV